MVHNMVSMYVKLLEFPRGSPALSYNLAVVHGLNGFPMVSGYQWDFPRVFFSPSLCRSPLTT